MVAADHRAFDFVEGLVTVTMPLQRELRSLGKHLVDGQAADVVEQPCHEEAFDVGLAEG
jgi:hypothetical protein